MNKNFLKSILLSGLILFPAMLAAQEKDGGVAFKRWENTLEAGLNTNFSESATYAVAEFSIGLKYWFNDRWGLGFDATGVAPYGFLDRSKSFSSVIDLGLAGAFRIISKPRSRLDLNVGVGSAVLAYSKSDYNLYCDCALRLGFLHDKTSVGILSGILRERRSATYAVNAWNALTRIGEDAPELRPVIGEVLEASALADSPPLFIRCFGSDRPLGILNRMRILTGAKLDRWGIPHGIHTVLERTELTAVEKGIRKRCGR